MIKKPIRIRTPDRRNARITVRTRARTVAKVCRTVRRQGQTQLIIDI